MWEKDEIPDEYYKHMLEAARAYKKSDSDKSPANRLTSEIVRWFEQQGGTARRVNTGGNEFIQDTITYIGNNCIEGEKFSLTTVNFKIMEK